MRLFLALVLLSSACFASENPYLSRVNGYLALNGRDPGASGRSGAVKVLYKKDGTLMKFEWNEKALGLPRPSDSDLPDEATALAAIEAFKVAKEAAKVAKEAAEQAAKQVAKPASIRRKENKLVKFLIAEGALTPTNTVVTVEKLEAMFDSWDLLPEPQTDAKSAKYERLMRPIRLRGIADTDIAFHPEVEKP